MNVIEKSEKVIDEVITQDKSPDIKKVLQETKISLESLKKSVDEKKITEPNKESSMNYLKDCITKMVDVQGLTAGEKKILNDIKIQIDAKNTIETIKIVDIITIVSTLEKKAEQLSAVDQEKIKELSRINVQHKVMLDGLKTAIVDVQQKLKEKKQEYITKVKEDLEKNRWSSWLAKPAYDYLMDKHINKKPIGKFREWLMGSVGIAVVGWFVGKDLKDMINNIETISLDDISQGEEKIKENAVKAEEYIDNVVENAGPAVKRDIERITGKKIDEVKFKEVFKEWAKEWGMVKDGYDKQDKETFTKFFDQKGEIKTLSEILKWIGFGPRAGFHLMIKLADAKLISRGDIMINGVEQTGKNILQFGLGSIGLFANTIRCAFGGISSDELAEYAKTHISRLNTDSKIALWAVLYRHGGRFWNIAGKVGTLTGEALSVLFNERTGGDIGKISAYRKGGVMGDIKKQLQVFKQVQESIKNTGMFTNIEDGSHILDDLIKTMDTNMSLFDIAQNATTTSELETLLRNNGHAGFIEELKKHPARGKGDMKKLQNLVGDEIEIKMQASITKAEGSFSTWKKFVGNNLKIKLPRSKFSGETELLTKMRDFSKLQGKLLQKTEFLHTARNLVRKFTVGTQLSGMVEYADKIKFKLNKVEDAKQFFDNMRTIGKSSPEILKTLFKGFPLIMVGKGVLDEMAAHPEDSKVKSIMKGIGYITPFVGSIMLINEGVTIVDGKFKDLTTAGIGLGIFGYDIYSFVKAARLGGKEAGKFLISPLRDSAAFIRSIGEGTYGFLKMTKDGIRVLSKERGALAFGQEALRFLKGAGLRLGIGAAILSGLTYRGYKEFFDAASKEEKEELAKLEGKSNEEIQKMIEQERAKLNDNQKSALIKVATAQKLQISNLDNIEVEKKGNKINVKVGTLVNKGTLGQVQFEIQESVSKMEGGKQPSILEYTLDGGEIKYILEGMKKEYFTTNDTFDKDAMKEYLIEMGYSEEDVLSMMQKIA